MAKQKLEEKIVKVFHETIPVEITGMTPQQIKHIETEWKKKYSKDAKSK